MDLQSVFFTDSNNGWAVGFGGVILNTTNGGTSWHFQNSGITSHLYSVHFSNADIGWTAGSAVLKTVNGGQNWFTQTVPFGGNDLFFIDTNKGWLVGYAGKILKTIDGGGVVSVNENVSNHFRHTVNFLLLQNYPNPFNPITKINYQIPKLSFVTMKVYDVLGKEVATLVNEEKPAGNYEIDFDGTGLPSGIYFYQLKAGNFVETKKMI
jgi:hypothetical protein